MSLFSTWHCIEMFARKKTIFNNWEKKLKFLYVVFYKNYFEEEKINKNAKKFESDAHIVAYLMANTNNHMKRKETSIIFF